MSSLSQKEGYSPIPPQSPHGEGSSDEDCESVQFIASQRRSSCPRSNRRLLLLGAVLLILSNCVSLLAGGLIGRKTVDLDRSCAAYTTQYCAILPLQRAVWELR